MAVYCRCAASREKRAALGALHTVAENEGWIIAGEFVDRKERSESAAQPEWQRLRSAIEAGSVNVVAVPSLMAIADGVSGLLAEILWLRDQGCDLYVHDAGLNTTSPIDRVLFDVVKAIKAVDDAAARRARATAGSKRKPARKKVPQMTRYQRRAIFRSEPGGGGEEPETAGGDNTSHSETEEIVRGQGEVLKRWSR